MLRRWTSYFACFTMLDRSDIIAIWWILSSHQCFEESLHCFFTLSMPRGSLMPCLSGSLWVIYTCWVGTLCAASDPVIRSRDQHRRSSRSTATTVAARQYIGSDSEPAPCRIPQMTPPPGLWRHACRARIPLPGAGRTSAGPRYRRHAPGTVQWPPCDPAEVLGEDLKEKSGNHSNIRNLDETDNWSWDD